MSFLFLFGLVGLLSFGFGVAGLWLKSGRWAVRPDYGLLLVVVVAGWALGFSAAFVLPPLLLVLLPSSALGRKLRWFAGLVLLGLLAWFLFSIYPFGQFALGRTFVGYLFLVVLYLRGNLRIFSSVAKVPGYQVGVVLVGLLLVSYFAFEEQRATPLVFLPLLLAWALLCLLPLAMKGLALKPQTWSVFGLLIAGLLLKLSHNLAEFIALSMAFAPLYLDGLARLLVPKIKPMFHLAEFWVEQRKWEPKLVAAGFSVAQFMVGLFAIQGTSFGYGGMLGFVGFVGLLMLALIRRETRLFEVRNQPQGEAEP